MKVFLNRCFSAAGFLQNSEPMKSRKGLFIRTGMAVAKGTVDRSHSEHNETRSAETKH